MKDISDISKIDWIQERVLPPIGNPKFGHLIPQGFEAYCKIFHSAFEDLDVLDKSRSWKDIDVASSEYKHLASRKLVHGINFNGRRVWLKDLAKDYKIPFTHKGVNELTRQVFWLIRYVTTNEGEMDFQTASNLSRVLASFTTEKIYYFSFYGWEKDLQILEGNLDEGIMNIESKKSVPGSPTFWWASDKSWCVVLDYDSNFSLCGASIETINALINDSELECLRIDINDDYC
jgi:hypothetical protein